MKFCTECRWKVRSEYLCENGAVGRDAVGVVFHRIPCSFSPASGVFFRVESSRMPLAVARPNCDRIRFPNCRRKVKQIPPLLTALPICKGHREQGLRLQGRAGTAGDGLAIRSRPMARLDFSIRVAAPFQPPRTAPRPPPSASRPAAPVCSRRITVTRTKLCKAIRRVSGSRGCQGARRLYRLAPC